MIRWLIHKLFGVSAYHRQASEVTSTRLLADEARRRAMQVRVDVLTRRGEHQP